MGVTELILFHECDTHITHRLSSLGDKNHSNPHIQTKKSLQTAHIDTYNPPNKYISFT